MGALFYSYGRDSIFKQQVGSTAEPAYMDLFSGIAGKDNLLIITSISIVTTETNQFFMTFDDAIHYYHFGKGVGQISISGMAFSDCEGEINGANAIYLAIQKARGQTVKCSAGGHVFQGVLTDCNVTFVSEPETMLQFTANFAMVEHDLYGVGAPSILC